MLDYDEIDFAGIDQDMLADLEVRMTVIKRMIGLIN